METNTEIDMVQNTTKHNRKWSGESNVYTVCGQWIQTCTTLSIVSQHLCIPRSRMFTKCETKPCTAHISAHYESEGGSLVYRMHNIEQCARASYSQGRCWVFHTSSNELMKTETIPTSHVQHISNPIFNSIIGTKCIFNINYAVLGNYKNNLEVELSMNYTNP